jgi:hypothetical protein
VEKGFGRQGRFHFACRIGPSCHCQISWGLQAALNRVAVRSPSRGLIRLFRRINPRTARDELKNRLIGSIISSEGVLFGEFLLVKRTIEPLRGSKFCACEPGVGIPTPGLEIEPLRGSIDIFKRPSSNCDERLLDFGDVRLILSPAQIIPSSFVWIRANLATMPDGLQQSG